MAESIVTNCPGCGRGIKCKLDLIGKMAKCPGCGDTFKVPVQGAAAPMLAAAPRAGTAPKAGAPTLEYKKAAPGQPLSDDMKRLILHAVLLLLVFVVLGGGFWAIRNFGPAPAPKLGDDDVIEEKMSEESGTEAREWLNANNRRMFGGWNTSQANFHLDKWYAMGAKKVYAFGGLMTLWVAIELPPEPEKRKELFDWTNKWHADNNLKVPTKDVGQKYLEVRLRTG